MTITLSHDAVYARALPIGRMLGLLSPGGKIVPVKYKSATNEATLMAGMAGPGGSPRSWTFKTRNSAILGSYQETWRTSPSSNELILGGLSLRLVEVAPSIPPELLAVHCEPLHNPATTSAAQARRACYKRGPHWHLSGGHPLVRGAHLLVPTSVSHTCYSSIDELDSVVKNVVQLIVDEVVQ